MPTVAVVDVVVVGVAAVSVVVVVAVAAEDDLRPGSRNPWT